MPTLGELSPAVVRDYWQIVRSILQEIFQWSEIRGYQDLQIEISNLPIEEQAIFYHADPLDVAADLAGAGNTDLSIYGPRYDEILKRYKWRI